MRVTLQERLAVGNLVRDKRLAEFRSERGYRCFAGFAVPGLSIARPERGPVVSRVLRDKTAVPVRVGVIVRVPAGFLELH